MADWELPEQGEEAFFQKKGGMLRSEDVQETQENNLIIEALSELSLLYQVPFAYLVPSDTLLEENEIKFFYLDHSWIRILLDGACSIGRNAGIDYTNDTVFLEDIYRKAIGVNDEVRLKLQGKAPNVHGRCRQAGSSQEICTGFLLKSELVRAFRGLEFRAYGDSKEESILKALRLETISNDILLGIYRGIITRLEIKEPPEGFHYGFNRYDDDGRIVLKKSVRNIVDGKLIYTWDEKKQADKSVEIEVVQRKNRVINMKETARNMEACRELFGAAADSSVNSAHIALEMIQNPHIIRVLADSREKE